MVTMTLDPGSVLLSEPGYVFDFCGGHLALDFVNTVGSRLGERTEHLATFGDVLAWAEARGVVSKSRAAAIRKQAAVDIEGARRARRSALEFRDALYRVLLAASSRRRPAAGDLATLNQHVSATFQSAAVTPSGDRFVLETSNLTGLGPVLEPVVRAAVDLMTSEALTRVGCCADETCGWLFLDTTRSHTRRWCDMKQCGNRNKVRRFRHATG
jgi:predicted RNA-binding Zn ribbon-like protein